MRITHLHQADLNLLVVLIAVAEERNLSRAADRLCMSQSAATRAMQRLRHLFQDELFVRVSGDYEPTPRGAHILQELEKMLPRLDRLLAGSAFDPANETARFRLAGTDYATHVIGIPLCKRFLAAGGSLTFEICPLTDNVYDSMERGRVDLLLDADDGRMPSHLSCRVLFEEKFVCVVARESRYAGRVTLDQYLKACHVAIPTFNGSQTIPDQRLRAAGLKRRCLFRVPYFSEAMHAAEGTDLIVTVPKRIALYAYQNPALRVIEAPEIMGRFQYVMIWHPRMESDAAHIWLRDTVAEVGAAVPD